MNPITTPIMAFISAAVVRESAAVSFHRGKKIVDGQGQPE